jgi:hypothetical protein
MKILRRAGLVFADAFVVIQLIRLEKDLSNKPSANGVAQQSVVSESVQTMPQQSCEDRPSNNTVHPWYADEKFSVRIFVRS